MANADVGAVSTAPFREACDTLRALVGPGVLGIPSQARHLAKTTCNGNVFNGNGQYFADCIPNHRTCI